MGRNIKRDLEIGQKAEELVKVKFNKKHGLKLEKNQDYKNKHYDLICAESGLTLEVKFDKYASKSGNIFIEYHNPKSNKPSGLYLTTAELWVLVLDNPQKIFICKVKKLKKFVKDVKPLRIVEIAGDKNSSGMLYKKDIILPIFTEFSKWTL